MHASSRRRRTALGKPNKIYIHSEKDENQGLNYKPDDSAVAAVKQLDLAGALLWLVLVSRDGVAGALFGIHVLRGGLGVAVAARGQRGLFVVVHGRSGVLLVSLRGSNVVCRVGDASTGGGVCTERSGGTRGGIDAVRLGGSCGRALSRGPARRHLVVSSRSTHDECQAVWLLAWAKGSSLRRRLLCCTNSQADTQGIQKNGRTREGQGHATQALRVVERDSAALKQERKKIKDDKKSCVPSPKLASHGPADQGGPSTPPPGFLLHGTIRTIAAVS